MGARWMRRERGDFAPSLAVVFAAEKSGGSDAGVQDARLRRAARFDVPYPFQFQAGVFREFWINGGRLPVPSQIRRGNDLAAEPGVVGGGEDAPGP